MATKLLLLASAGAFGTLARYFLGGAVQRLAGGAFPWGTFAVNMTGTLLFGLVWSLAEDRLVISSEARTIILVGFMGAFTTFSSFMFETGELMRDEAHRQSLAVAESSWAAEDQDFVEAIAADE